MSTRITVNDVIGLLSVLADEAKLKATVKGALQSGLVVGVCTTIGALLAGPRYGTLIGAAIGGLGASYYSSGKFESVGTILTNMDDVKKKELFAKACDIFSKFHIDDIDTIRRALTEPEMKKQLLDAVVEHVEGQLHMDIIH